LFFFRFVASGATRSADSSFETCKGCQKKARRVGAARSYFLIGGGWRRRMC
jgi:hypothetical protein